MMLSNEMAGAGSSAVAAAAPAVRKPKLHGRAFYESIGSPKYIIAPMVNQSEFVSGWQAELELLLEAENGPFINVPP